MAATAGPSQNIHQTELRLPEKTSIESSPYEDSFFLKIYSLGDFSALFDTDNKDLENLNKPCRLEIPFPTNEAKSWISALSVICAKTDDEGRRIELFEDLGEAEFTKGYQSDLAKPKLVMKGEAAEELIQRLIAYSDSSNFESPVIKRVISWGPNRVFELYSLRASRDAGALAPVLECILERDGELLRSCSLNLQN